MNVRWSIPVTVFFLELQSTLAHCPLCTVGIAAAAGGAAYLGVDKAVIALFVGAFAVSTGWWVARKIKKQLIPFQMAGIILLSFLLTTIPLLPLLDRIYPIYISVAGDYGSWLNRTYIINLSLISSILGGAAVGITPWLSAKLTGLRQGKKMPYQGVLLTLGILLITSIIIQQLTV